MVCRQIALSLSSRLPIVISMLHPIVCAVLYCTVLCCTYGSAAQYSMLCMCILWWRAELGFQTAVLCCTVLYCTVPECTCTLLGSTCITPIPCYVDIYCIARENILASFVYI